jgi:hypothetical protein
MLESPLKVLLAIGAFLFVWRIASNRRTNREYARLPASQKRLIPRRWL